MSRPAVLALVAALGLTSLSPVVATPAGAADDTCHGVAATLVGSPGAALTGTPGADVVVTNGAASVDTGDGDDVVCTTGTPATASGLGVTVDVGAGDDTVDTSAEGPRPGIGTTLGDGDDTFVGGRADDSVDARDEGHDSVRTGGGNDSVSTGSSEGVDDDLVDAGASGDHLLVGGRITPTSHISGGGGRDDLYVNVLDAGRWVFDNRGRQVRHDGATAWRWAGVERFFFAQTKTVGRISFIGGPGDELLYVATSAFAGARLGGGNDDVLLASPRRLPGTPAIRAGAGRDRLQVLPYGTQPPVPHAELDLGSGSLRYVDRKGRRTSVLVTGFEGADAHAHSVRITGSTGDDVLTAWACDVQVNGGDGNDRLGTLSEDKCASGTRRALFGGPGHDRLSGSFHADLLVGGPGVDRADGYDGRDRCEAETERRCELPAAHARVAAESCHGLAAARGGDDVAPATDTDVGPGTDSFFGGTAPIAAAEVRESCELRMVP